MLSEIEHLPQRSVLGFVSRNCRYGTAAAAARHTGFYSFFRLSISLNLKALSPFDNACSIFIFRLFNFVSIIFSPSSGVRVEWGLGNL